MAGARPIRIAIVNDYEIVVAGVAAMLAPHHERVQVVELDSGLPVISDVDVILYDTFGQVQGDGVDLEDLVNGCEAKVVIFSWNLQPELVQKAIDRGAAGYLSKGMSADDDRRRRSRRCTRARPSCRDESAESVDRGASGEWPGREAGLTAREAEVIALITQGLSNQEIAHHTYLSINSVKTYIRTAYRKIERRPALPGGRVGHAARLRAGPQPDRRPARAPPALAGDRRSQRRPVEVGRRPPDVAQPALPGDADHGEQRAGDADEHPLRGLQGVRRELAEDEDEPGHGPDEQGSAPAQEGAAEDEPEAGGAEQDGAQGDRIPQHPEQ